MLIDDQIQSLNSLKAALEARGYGCSIFNGPCEAVEHYSSEKFDIVITDVYMPGMNGFEVGEAIRRLNPDAGIVLMTGFHNRFSKDIKLSDLDYPILYKPIDSTILLDTIQNLTKYAEEETDENQST